MEGKDLLCPITSVRGFPEGCTCQKDRCAWYEPELKKCSVLVIAKELEEHAAPVAGRDKSRNRSFHSLETAGGRLGGRGLCHAENRGHPGSGPHYTKRGTSERQWRSAANRSRLPPRSVLGAPHRGTAPEAAAETDISNSGGFCYKGRMLYKQENLFLVW